MQLPQHVTRGLDRLLERVSRNDLMSRAFDLSLAYRQGVTSAQIIKSSSDALAYAVTRMPATYAAVVAALNKASQNITELSPRTLLDLGAGPGAASFAALELWPDIEQITMLEPNVALAGIARSLASESDVAVIRGARIVAGNTDAVNALEPADLVTLSYVLVELPPAHASQLVDRAYALAQGALILVEPGTTRGFARIRAARTQLIALGAAPIAPCPHALECPMTATDWCHFSVRLARSRDHKLAKAADAPFEDEKFSYLVVTRKPAGPVAEARLIGAPRISRGEIALRLCTPTGIIERRVSRRAKSEYRAARRLRWGDALCDS